MADVTVNIRGNSSQLREELDDVQRRYGSSGSNSSHHTAPQSVGGSGISSSVPSNERMIEDVRREMRQRGVLMIPGSTSMAQIINQYTQSTRESVNNDITGRYDSRRADMRNRMSADYDRIDEDIDNKRRAELKKLGPLANDPQVLEQLEEKLFKDKEEQYRIIGSKYDLEEEQINREEEDERSRSELELTNAIKELTNFFNRRSSNNQFDDPDSYVGQLRIRQRELTAQRDQAATEEEAMAASANLAEVNEKLRAVMGGGDSPYAYDPVLQGTRGIQDMLNGLSNGSMSSTIMGAGGAYAALSGMGMKAAMKFLGWVGVAAGLANAGEGVSDRYESMAGLAGLRYTAGGRQGKAASDYLNSGLPDWYIYGDAATGINYTDLGLDREEFAAEAARRIKARGTSENWFDETLKQIALEKAYALNQGSLESAGQYDRYGWDATYALTDLVTKLSSKKGTGVNWKDFTRVQEKLDIQQMIMGSWMSRNDKPDIGHANDMVIGFSSVPGIVQDSRIGSDYMSFQNMIQNPVNENMRALIYSSIADIFPETGGRLDLIDRALRDSKNEGEIMSAVVQRLVQQFGGTDTQMGYFVFKNLLPDIAPDRLDDYVKALSDPNSDTSRSLRHDLFKDDTETVLYNEKTLTQESKEYQTAMTRGLDYLSDQVQQLLDFVIGNGSMVSGNRPEAPSGGNR